MISVHAGLWQQHSLPTLVGCDACVRYVRITNSPTGMLIQAFTHVQGRYLPSELKQHSFLVCPQLCLREMTGMSYRCIVADNHDFWHEGYSGQTIFFFRAALNMSRPDIIFAYRPRAFGAGRSTYAVRQSDIIKWYRGVKIIRVWAAKAFITCWPGVSFVYVMEAVASGPRRRWNVWAGADGQL